MKKPSIGAGTARTSDMSEKKHEILLIIASLMIASCALLYSVLDSPKYNRLEAVPFISESVSYSTTEYTGMININTAGTEELTQLELIGEIKAQAIIDYRNENGAFRTVEEITNVEGISFAILEKNFDKITV